MMRRILPIFFIAGILSCKSQHNSWKTESYKKYELYEDSFHYFKAKYDTATKEMLTADSSTKKEKSQKFEYFYKLMMNATDSSAKYLRLWTIERENSN